MLTVLIYATLTGIGQDKGDRNVVKQDRQLSGFTGLEASGAVTVYLAKADTFSVVVETDENLQDNVSTKVQGNTLVIKTNTIRKATKLNVYVSLPELKSIKAAGASDVVGTSTFEAEEFDITASGAASVKLDLNVAYLESVISGAADVKLTGTAHTHNLEVSGAGSLNAEGLSTNKAHYMVSGASDTKLNVSDELSGTKKGMADLSYSGNPNINSVSGVRSDNEKNYVVSSDNYNDSVKVKVGRMKVEVFDGDDSVKVIVGNREIKVDDEGNVRMIHRKRPKFNGHWAGFGIGLNGYVNTDYNQSFPQDYEYLDLRMTKSVAVHVNFFEQNVSFAKNQKWGMVTGLGFNWNNYRFDHPTRLEPESSVLIGYLERSVSIRKSKLTALYLNVPLIFEFQTNSKQKKNSFHIGIGMIANARLSSHTKKYYDERNKNFEVTRYDPESGKYLTEFTATSPDYSKAKHFDDYHLQPFKFDATVRIGWGFVNLFANYSVNPMFKLDKGPELYPWTIGITLVNL